MATNGIIIINTWLKMDVKMTFQWAASVLVGFLFFICCSHSTQTRFYQKASDCEEYENPEAQTVNLHPRAKSPGATAASKFTLGMKNAGLLFNPHVSFLPDNTRRSTVIHRNLILFCPLRKRMRLSIHRLPSKPRPLAAPSHSTPITQTEIEKGRSAAV